MDGKNWHDKSYKWLLLIPTALIIFSFIFMISFEHKNGDILYKDISLTGGTSITIYETINTQELTNALSGKLLNLNIREVYDLTTREQKAVIIETTIEGEQAKQIIEDYLGFELVEGQNSDFEFTGSNLSQSFYKQLLFALFLAFLFMAIVVFIIFRNLVPSAAVIISAFADILMTLVLVNILKMTMSTAGIVAFLMLIGYSVDTDIMLTTRILKRQEGSLNERLFGAFKTGMTMTLTSFFGMLVALLIVSSFSGVLTQVFTILTIGLGFDILNTWVTNVSILKWYMEKKK